MEALAVHEQHLLDLIERSIPAGTAHVAVSPRNSDQGIVIDVQPRNSGAAAIRFHVDNLCHLDVEIGVNSHLEFDGPRITDPVVEREVAAMLAAITSGLFEEDVWYLGTTVTKSVGRLTGPAGAKRITTVNSVSSLLRRGNKSVRKYDAY